AYTKGGRVALWNFEAGAETLLPQSEPPGKARALAFARGGQQLAVACTAGSGSPAEKPSFILLWDLAANQQLGPIWSDQNLNSVCHSPDATRLLAWSDAKTVSVFHAGQRREEFLLRADALRSRVGAIDLLNFEDQASPLRWVGTGPHLLLVT